MNSVTPEQISLWSKLGPRAVYGQTVQNLIESNCSVIALSADLGSSSGLDRLRRSNPDKLINVGIAEQCLVGFSAGLAKEGLVPFASTFAPFATMRAAEQIRMNLGYMNLNVKLVGIGSGLSMGFLGNSHYGLEDIAIMRTVPGMTILSPADCFEVVKCVEHAAQLIGPTYIRLTGLPNNPIVYDSDYDFKIGKAIRFGDGEDIAIIATGSMVWHALETSKLLQNFNVNSSIFNFHTLKPLDLDTLDKVVSSFKRIVTVEEHSEIGGLGSTITQYFANKKLKPEILVLGLPDDFGPTGNYEYLLSFHELNSISIARKVQHFFQF